MSGDPEIEAMSKVFNALEPLDVESRSRVARWALDKLQIQIGTAPKNAAKSAEDTLDFDGAGDLPTAAALWLKQNGIESGELESVFHIEGDEVEVIAAQVPGKSNKERVLNCYVLMGALELLRGNTSFSDKDARSLCETYGCFDTTNHAKYLNDKGNEFAGSKDKGWTLTAPGKKRAATLVKEMATA
jgi:hypothetical protein